MSDKTPRFLFKACIGRGRILPKCSYENSLFGKMSSRQRSHIHFKGCWEDDFPLEDDAGYVSFPGG